MKGIRMDTVPYRNADVTTVTLIQVAHNVGQGVNGDPVREVVELHTLDGRLVAEWDTWTGASRAVHLPS